MSKKTDIEKVREIMRNGFKLPDTVERWFETIKARAIEATRRAREDGDAKLRDFSKNLQAMFDALPAEEKTVRDVRFVAGKPEYYNRPLRRYEWAGRITSAIIKDYPYYGRSNEDAERMTAEAVDFKRIQFIIRTNGITGDEITGADIFLDPSGDINGTITGKNGTASVQTITAGGYNIQCLHFRCLVREVK